MALPAQTITTPMVGDYRILDRIASGGMGVVYKALDLRLQRVVALKFVSLDHTPNKNERERLLREARAASVLDHENIAAIHRVGETEDGQLFIDMGFYEGENLATRMARAPLTNTEALEVMTQVTRGLAHAHAHNVIHRDIKPSNVILTNDGVAKIVDFGLARVLSPEASTASLDIAGTLSYMSPEQLTGKPVDVRTDIWSLGVMMYELLAKRLPFFGGSTASVINAILNNNPAHMAELPQGTRPIVQRALEKNPALRYQTAGEILADLERLQHGTSRPAPVGALGVFKTRLRRLPLRWMFTALLVFAVLMIVPRTVNDGRPSSSTPVSPNELYQQALVLLDRFDKPDNLNSAIQKLETVTKADPRSALAYAALGEAYVDKFRLGQDGTWLDRARESCNRASQINNGLARVHVTMARINTYAKNYDLARQDIQHALELEPGNVKAILTRGDIFAGLSQYSQAEKEYQRAVNLRPGDWEAYLHLGNLHLDKRDYEAAVKQFRKVLELTPDNEIARSNLAAALTMQGKYKQADAEMRESLRLSPSYAGYYNLALRYYGEKRYAEAVAISQLAKGQSEADYKIWQLLGLCYEWMGRPEDAQAAYNEELHALEKSAPLKQDDALAQAELAVLYAKRHRADDAMKHLQTALTLKKDDPEVLALVGETYETLSNRQQAISYIMSALSKGWDIGQLYSNPDLRRFCSDVEVQKRLRKFKRAQEPTQRD